MVLSSYTYVDCLILQILLFLQRSFNIFDGVTYYLTGLVFKIKYTQSFEGFCKSLFHLLRFKPHVFNILYFSYLARLLFCDFSQKM